MQKWKNLSPDYAVELTDFKEQETSLAERFVEAVLNGPSGQRLGEEFGNAFSVGGYLPTIIDAQHWSVEILEASDVQQMEELGDLDLITEIFCQCYIPYDTGEVSYEEAKANGIKLAKDFFAGTDKEIMFDGQPSSAEWFALHIYQLSELIDHKIQEEVGFRKEVDELAGDVDDYYVSEMEPDRYKERRLPFVQVVDAAIKIGFLYRDAWWLEQHGDAAALGYTARRIGAKAGIAGGKASRKRRLANLKILIEEIEKLSGVVDLISEERIVAQAIESSQGREPYMPKSKKTLDEYGTALRSEEPFKTRYEAVFRKNA